MAACTGPQASLQNQDIVAHATDFLISDRHAQQTDSEDILKCNSGLQFSKLTHHILAANQIDFSVHHSEP